MKTPYFGFAAIAALQACSTAPASELGVVQAEEPSAAVLCLDDGRSVYKWTDEEGNVYFGDRLPPGFVDRPKSEAERSAEQDLEQEQRRLTELYI